MNHPLRSFDIKTDSNGNTIKVKISETPGLVAENLGLDTWGSSYILANQLYRWHEDAVKANTSSLSNPPNPNGSIGVLELGAGTSLVGISAAAIWQLPVIVTDLAPLIPGLAQNIIVNREMLVQRWAMIECGVLDWSKPSELQLHQGEFIDTSEIKANVILAADTVYAEDHPELLTRTISMCLSRGEGARVIFCYVLRHSYIEIIRELWESLDGLGLECVEEGQMDADPDTWDDVAPFEWCVWRWKRG